MTATSSIGSAFRTALVAAATVAISDPDVLIIQGAPSMGERQSPGSNLDAVVVGGLRSVTESGPMGSQRSQYETLECHVLFKVDRIGDVSDQDVYDRAMELLGAVEHYVRFTDSTVGGVLESPAYCRRTVYESASDSWGDDTTFGRRVEIDATFTVFLIRIAN